MVSSVDVYKEIRRLQLEGVVKILDDYEENKYDDCTDDCYFNHEKNTVSLNHIWEITTHTLK